MTAQLRDAACSISANIAEGCGRCSDADFARFLHNALASACECLDRTIAACDEGYLTSQQFEELEAELEIVRRMLTRLIERLRRKKQGL